MAYGNNILPMNASAYQLNNATLIDGVLTVDSGGYARYSISKQQLGALPDMVQVNLISDHFTSGYNPQVCMHLYVETPNKCYNYTVFPVSPESNIYSTEVQFDEAEYDTFTVEITSNELVSFTLWEVCPQSTGDVEVIIEGVKQSLPKLLYDYNTTPIRIEQSEQIVGMINCHLLDSTDLQSHFLMNFTASDRCTVYVRFFDTAMCELFSPIVHTVNPGYNTIEVPHAYLQKMAGSHTFYVTAQATNGYLSVPIRSVLYTIDGGYLAERVLNPGMDVTDIAIRQLDTDRAPSEIWAIGVDNNKVIVKKREYDQYNTSLWDAVYAIGEGTHAAIEFDGNWVRRPGSKKHTIHTNHLPMIAFVDPDSILWVYMHGMDSAPIQMATGVTCVSLVRGYKSLIYPDKDQGMILCWVQNGDVFYKQYAYFNGMYQWYPTEQLTTSGDITFVQVHRLNDFRIGIVTQSATENIWYITDRTYVGQSVDTETTRTRLSGLYDFAIMTSEEAAGLSFDATQNTFDSVEDPQQDFVITFAWPKSISFIHDTLESWKEQITFKINGTQAPTDTFDLTIVDNVLTIHTHEPVWGNVALSWNKISFWFHATADKKVINTQASYSFSWTITHKMKFSQPVDTANATLGGSAIFAAIPTLNLKAACREPITGNMDGSATFTVLPILNPKNSYVEPITCNMDGTAVFTCELVGVQPI